MTKKINWKRIIGWAIAAFVVGFIVYSNMKEQKALQETGKKNIYALLALSGPGAQYGKDMRREIDALMKEKNYPFNVIYLDSAGEGMKAVSAFQQATLNDDHPVIITSFSSVSSALAPLVERKKGFMFALSTFVVKSETDNFIKLMGDEETVMAPVYEYIKKHNLKSLGIFYIETDYGLKEYKYIRENLKDSSTKISKVVSTAKSAYDVRGEALKLITSEPDAILILGETVPAYMNLIRELKAQDYRGKIIADGGLRVPMVSQLLGENSLGIVFPALTTEADIPHSPQTEEAIQMLKKYKLPTYYILLEVADTLQLIQYTIDNNLPFSRKTYENIKDWKGVMEGVSFHKEKAVGHRYIMTTFKNGKIVPVEE